MLPLVLGLALFLLVHLVPTNRGLRSGLVSRFGEGAYKAIFSLMAVAGFVLIVVGYGKLQSMPGKNPELWMPPLWARHITLVLMIPALILLVAYLVPSHIRSAVRHPMLAAIKIWALAHLIANGDLASVLLFGSFLAFAVYDRISVKRRAVAGPAERYQGGPGNDILVVVAGLALYLFMLLYGHAWLIGVPLLPGSA